MSRKLSVQEFRKIKEESKVKNYPEFQDKLLSYDLSNIPFEEWKNFEIWSDREHIADFSKTHANIDFKLVKLNRYFTPGNFKGCNVKNIDADLNLINPDSFDDNTINNNSSLFLSNMFTSEFKEKYYARKLIMPDLISLNVEQLKELDTKFISSHLLSDEENIIVTELGLNKSIELFKYSEDEYDFVKKILYFMIVSTNQDYIKNRAKQLCKTLKESDVKDSKNLCNSYLRKFILNENAYKIFLYQIPEVFINENKDLFLLDVQVLDYIKNLYYQRNLTVKDIFYNLDKFSKFPIEKFISNDNTNNDYKLIESLGYGNLTKLMKKYYDFFQYIIENNLIFDFYLCLKDIKNKKGEKKFREAVKKFFIENGYNHLYSKWFQSMNFNVLQRIITLDDLMNCDDDTLVLDKEQRTMINIFGLDNLKKLHNESEIFKYWDFSCNNFGDIASAVCFNIDKFNLTETKEGENFKEGNLPYDVFEKRFVEYLNRLRLNDYYLTLYCINSKFAEKYPETFVDPNSPKELKKAFYKNKITPDFLFGHSEYIPYLLNKNLLTAIKTNTSINVLPRNKLFDFPTIYLKKYGNEKFLKLLVKYGDVLNNLEINSSTLDKEKELEKSIQESIYKKIVYYNYNKTYNYQYLKSIKDFVNRYPDIFTDFSGLSISIGDKQKEKLEKKYYSGNLKFNDIKKYPQLIEILKNKNLKSCFRCENLSIHFFDEKRKRRKVFLLDLIDILGNDNFLKICQKYGDYFKYVAKELYKKLNFYNISDKNIILKDFSFADIDNILEKELIDKCLSGDIHYSPEDAPDFLKQQHPELFLSEDAPEELKNAFYKNLTFTFLYYNKAWLPYLKGKSIRVALVRDCQDKNVLNYFFDVFGEDTVINFAMKKLDSIISILSLGDLKYIDLMESWYNKTGRKFIPDFIVIDNIDIKEADKFFANSTYWTKLMKLEEYSKKQEIREAMLKLAYSFGVFDGDKRGFNKLYDLLTKIPKKINEETFYSINDITLKKLFGAGEICNIDDFISHYNTTLKNIDITYFEGEGITKDNLKNLLYAIKEENFNLDYSKGIISQIYRKNDDMTYTLIINQQRYPKTINAIREFLMGFDIKNILKPEKIHQLFGGFKLEYNPEFREFLLDNLDEILNNPEYSGYISSIQKQFKDIKIVNSNRKLTLDLAVSYVLESKYEDVEVGNEKVAEVSAIAGYTQEDFDTLQKIYNYGKQRVFSSIPRIEGNTEKYTYEMLRLDDPLAMAIGTLTDCCQEIGNVAETCMEHSMVDKNGRVFVIKDKEGNIVSQSWVWRNKDVICFDNIEIPDKAFARVEDKYKFTDEVYNLYEKAAHELIEKDEKEYKKLRDEGKITEEQYEGLVLSKVTVGLGYNDIAQSIEKHAKYDSDTSRPLPFKQPIHLGRNLYTSDSTTQYILKENEKENDYDVDTLHVHNDLYKIYDDSNFNEKDLLALTKLELQLKEYSDTADILNETKENLVSEIGNLYDLNPDTTKIVMNSNFGIIYEENDNKVTIGDILYNTKIQNEEQKIDIEPVVILQIRLALEQIGKNKEIDISNLDDISKEIYNKAMKLTEDNIDEEKGIKINR